MPRKSSKASRGRYSDTSGRGSGRTTARSRDRRRTNTSGRTSGRTTKTSRSRFSDVRYEVAKTGRADGYGYVEWQKYRNTMGPRSAWIKMGKPVRQYGPSKR